MTYEIEHKAGSSKEAILEAERQLRKDLLAQQMGITREHFDELVEQAKSFFNSAEKNARSKGSSTVKQVGEL